MKTYVIADPGSCCDGDLAKMLQVVDVAKEVGLDAIKYQWVSDPVAMATRRGRALADGYAEVYRRFLAWPKEWHVKLAERCRVVGIDYMCTTYLPADIEVVAPHVAHFKVASFEAEDFELLGAHASYRQDVLVSLGMAASASHAALSFPVGRLRLLHCVSSYPAPVSDLNLAVLQRAHESKPWFRYSGFSDHSDPDITWTGALAVAVGGGKCEIIEAHLRLDGTDPANPDYLHAMTPRQFGEYVSHIRFAETCLGSGEKRLQDCEQVMARYLVRP